MYSNFELKNCNWLNKPNKVLFQGTSESECTIFPESKSDFWKRTYYDPELIHDNGHFLYTTIPNNENVTIESKVIINPKNQFDQGGLMIRLDSENWIKFGLEIVDLKPKLGAVVTKNGYSDWSTQNWNNCEYNIRLHKIANSCVCEVENEKDNWEFIRISHLDISSYKEYQIGIFACCPTESGAEVKFINVNLKECKGIDHKA